MRAMVTGAAGFIGAELVQHLVTAGWDVLAVDVRDPRRPAPDPRLRIVRLDLVTADAQILDRLLGGVDVVFHLAGQTGVRTSWSDGFTRCARDNIDATQRLLEAARRHPPTRFVFASSSSVYGGAPDAVSEGDPTVPHSPYGVTKLAAELLCRSYAANFGIPTVSLRYFTVYGPGQRADMSIHRLIRSAIGHTPFHVYGNGSQSRDFTYVTDVARATLTAATADLPIGEVINIAGGEPRTMTDTIRLVETTLGRPITTIHRDPAPGDVHTITANITRARNLLGWQPEVRLEEGIALQTRSELAVPGQINRTSVARMVS